MNGRNRHFYNPKKNKFKSKKKINLKYTVHWPKETIRNKSTEFEKKKHGKMLYITFINAEKCFVHFIIIVLIMHLRIPNNSMKCRITHLK